MHFFVSFYISCSPLEFLSTGHLVPAVPEPCFCVTRPWEMLCGHISVQEAVKNEGMFYIRGPAWITQSYYGWKEPLPIHLLHFILRIRPVNHPCQMSA